MKDSEILKEAVTEGFCESEIISTDTVEFDYGFRFYCEENLCGQYGANYSCPPDCGTPEEMKLKMMSHKRALVVKTEWEIEDLSQSDKLKTARDRHNAAMLRLIKTLRDQGHSGFMIGAGGCTICDPCKIVIGQPCAHPTLMYSCMSSYCIHVKKLAEDCGMNYDYKNNILPFFGMYVFD